MRSLVTFASKLIPTRAFFVDLGCAAVMAVTFAGLFGLMLLFMDAMVLSDQLPLQDPTPGINHDCLLEMRARAATPWPTIGPTP